MTTNLTLSDLDKIQLRNRVKASLIEDLKFTVCPTCAKTEVLFRKESGTGILTAELGDNCFLCSEFHRKHPEVAEWVTQFLAAASFIRKRLPPEDQ